MFSVEQKRSIANAVQQILQDTGHPELPIDEIQFKLYVHGRFQWSWADIQNNEAVSNPSVNPWNEAQGKIKLHTPKPLAQYLAEYVEYEQSNNEENCGFIPGIDVDFQGQSISICIWELEAMLRQALDAYESTENVTIKIERK